MSIKALTTFITVILWRYCINVVDDKERAIINRNGAENIFLDILIVCIYMFDWIR